MSSSYRIICKETKQAVWIGQGFGGMKIFYSGEPETMEKLHRFLDETKGKELIVVNTDCTEIEFEDYI
jgi:hypothetical protein